MVGFVRIFYKVMSGKFNVRCGGRVIEKIRV